MSQRHYFVFSALALVISFFIVRLVGAPGYTDAFYHYNAAVRVATGQGLTEPYLWTYIGAPLTLPSSGFFPSHLYWLPLTSLASAAGMALLGVNYAGAQAPFILFLAGTGIIGFWLGFSLSRTVRLAWMAGLLTLFSGFFTRYWGMTDTFAVYALVGSGCLVGLGWYVRFSAKVESAFGRKIIPFGVLIGMLAGLGHLTRADGMLLIMVGVISAGWFFWRKPQLMIPMIAALVVGYLVVMGGWFIRNLNEAGTPLPLGGTQSIWFRTYDDLFDFPPENTPQTMFADGADAFIASRIEALMNNLGTFIAVEGMIVLVPLMLIGLCKRRKQPFLFPFMLYALGLHLAMTFVFPFPGYRGGLLHSAAALIPFWAALGAVGLDDVLDWVGKRRRTWRGNGAKLIFGGALVLYAVGLSVWIGARGRVEASEQIPTFYTTLSELIPPDARVMINDPAMLYTYTGLGGVVVPNESPDIIAEIAERYAIDYVVIEPQGVPAPMAVILEAAPDFLNEIAQIGAARVYEIEREN